MESARTAIIEATVDAYVDDPSHLTPEAICERAGVDREEFDRHFDSVNGVIRAWYVHAVDGVLTHTGGIVGFEALPLHDRLGTLCFMLLDQLESRITFVRATFIHHASGFGSPFHRRLRTVLQTIIAGADVPGVNYLVVDTNATRFIIAESIIQLIVAWLDDESAERARSAALIDRTLSLQSEIITNRIPEKAVDLVRYAVEAGYLPLNRLPLIGDLFERSSQEE